MCCTGNNKNSQIKASQNKVGSYEVGSIVKLKQGEYKIKEGTKQGEKIAVKIK